MREIWEQLPQHIMLEVDSKEVLNAVLDFVELLGRFYSRLLVRARTEDVS